MTTTNINQTTTTNLTGGVKDFSFSSSRIDEAGNTETYWYNTEWPTFLGYYKKSPELKAVVDSLNMWAFGKGYTCESTNDKVILEHIQGWGEDTFDSIIDNQGRVEDLNGDAYAEIIKDPDTNILLNLKPLNPSNVRHVVNSKGILIGYDVNTPESPNAWKRFKPQEIFHTAGGRIANEIHGTSKVEACKWIIDARNEAMSDKRRILHRSTIRVIEVDSDDTTKLATIKNQYKEAIKNGEVLIVPKDNVSFPDVPPLSTAEHSDWIRYLEQAFYKQFGVAEPILGGSGQFTEANSKVSFLSFEVPYSVKARRMEQDIWNQLQIKVTFNKPPSLQDNMQESEAANTGQISFQPNEVMAQAGRVE